MTTTAVCRECHRVFDLTDDRDAGEWGFGHDCEPPAALDESDMDWHRDTNGRPCACIEPEHDAMVRITYTTALRSDMKPR